MIKAKILIQEKAEQLSTPENTYKIMGFPVIDGSEENKEFFAFTPSGHLELGLVKKETADLFEVGKEYYLTFEKAETK